MPTPYPKGPIEWTGSPKDFTGNYNLGPYAIETTQRYMYGTRAITWDGRVFKYSKSVGSLLASYGAANLSHGSSNTIARLINSVTPNAYSIGDRVVKVTIAATECYAGDGVLAKDELAGAYMVCGHGATTTTNNRLIISNTAVDSGGGTTNVTLEYPISQAVGASAACEIPLNPYRYLGIGSYDYNAFMCVPQVNASTGYNFWGQTWGPTWVVPGGGDTTPGDTADDRTAFFVGDGSVNFGYSLTIESGYQKAGFCIDPTVSGTGAMPLIMLQISV